MILKGLSADPELSMMQARDPEPQSQEPGRQLRRLSFEEIWMRRMLQHQASRLGSGRDASRSIAVSTSAKVGSMGFIGASIWG